MSFSPSPQIIANLPSNLSIAIQEGYLYKEWEMPLTATYGFRSIADKETYPENAGETITRTRGGLLSAITTPLNPSTNTGLDNGLTPQYWNAEQYVLNLVEYASTMDLNIVNQNVSIAEIFLQNAKRLGEQAVRSIDGWVRDILFGANIANQLNGAYMGGNTRVTATLGSPGPTIAVDDIRGFYFTIPLTGANAGRPNIPTSPTNTQPVQVGSNMYTLIGATADVVNISTSFGGVSGTLTFSTNVTVLDGTLNNAVISAYAPAIVRPNNRATTAALVPSDIATLTTFRNAALQLENNGVPGPYTALIPPVTWTQLYQDPEFQLLFRGTEFNSPEYKNLKPSGNTLGFNIIVTNMSPSPTPLGSVQVKRPIMCGAGCVLENDFAGASSVIDKKYGSVLADITEVNGIYHVTRTALDRLQQIITQSWFYIGGFTAPTDQTTNPSTIPTASSAYYKRAVVIETA